MSLANVSITKYIESAKVHFNVDYGNKKSVKDGNKAADQMRKIASDIESLHPEWKNEFVKLLNMSDYKVNQWVAHHILEVMKYDEETQKMALSIIEKLAAGNDVDALGNRMWLRDWYSKHNYK